MLLLFFKQKIAVPYHTVPPERTPLPQGEGMGSAMKASMI